MLRKEDGALRDRALVVYHAVVVHVLSGQDGGPTGRAERGGDEGVGEMGTLLRESIHGRGLKPLRGVFVKAHEIVAVIVAENEEDVGLCLGGEGRGGEEQTEQAKGHTR